MQELATEEIRGLKNFLRMDLNYFNFIFEMIRPYIIRKDTKLRCSIKPEERFIIALTLRFLATGM